MRKLLITVLSIAGVLVVLKVVGERMQNVDWEKRFEQMPDNAPPKWMFRNLAAIRESTDRILEILEEEPSPSDPPAAEGT